MSPVNAEVSEPLAHAHRSTMDALMTALSTRRLSEGHLDSVLLERDPEAVWLLRDGGAAYNERDDKMKGKRLTDANRQLADTHGFLFKRTRS